MADKLKLIVLTFLLMGSAIAQSTQGVVYANPIQGYTANSANDTVQAVLAPQYMIGQTNHVVYVSFADINGGSCTAPGATAHSIPIMDIYGSYDGVGYTVITTYERITGANSSVPTDRFRWVLQGVGAFPFVRITIQNFNSLSATGCKVSAFYYGTQSSFDPKKQLQFGLSNDALFTGSGVVTTATTSVMCPLTPNARQTLYALYLVNNNAAVDQVTVQDGFGSTMTFSLPANGSIALSSSTTPYFQAVATANISLVTTNTNTVTYLAVCRGE